MMRALTIRQPWAACIARGHKAVENRPHSTPYRGEVAIHAGLGWADCGEQDRRCRLALGPELERDASDRGVILAVAVLGPPHPAQGCCGPWGDPVYRTARGVDVPCWHWPLFDVRRLSIPVRASGALGLWQLSADRERDVRAALREGAGWDGSSSN
ncbi:MAG TPA: hypothetical protein VL595_22360 [Pseudonocardia sp.]|jgi:hypothetical protein|nr:hypothetical protein [Pseudonocardia sp.]